MFWPGCSACRRFFDLKTHGPAEAREKQSTVKSSLCKLRELQSADKRYIRLCRGGNAAFFVFPDGLSTVSFGFCAAVRKGAPGGEVRVAGSQKTPDLFPGQGLPV